MQARDGFRSEPAPAAGDFLVGRYGLADSLNHAVFVGLVCHLCLSRTEDDTKQRTIILMDVGAAP